MSAMPAFTWRSQLARFLPSGQAWKYKEGGFLDRLIAALAEEFARADARLERLLDEADPRTTLELLADWERVAGLPDSCTGMPDSISERQAALVQKLTARGGQSIAYFTEVAARLGYAITIDEPDYFEAGDDVGYECGSEDWRHVWIVNVHYDGDLPNLVVFSAGDDAGRRLVDWGSIDLECIIARLKPAHTIVHIAYEE